MLSALKTVDIMLTSLLGKIITGLTRREVERVVNSH